MSRVPIGRAGSATAAVEQPGQALRHGVDGLAGEQVGAVVEPQPQPLARRRQEAQRIMRGIVPGDAGEAQAGGFGGESRLVDRIVLEHRQGVEQVAQAGETLDLGEAQMLMRDEPRLAVLQVAQQLDERLAGR